MRQSKLTHEKRSFDTVATQFTPNQDMKIKVCVFTKRKPDSVKILNYVAITVYHKVRRLSIFSAKLYKVLHHYYICKMVIVD